MFFTIPLPPGINKTYGTNTSGKFYKKPQVKEWEEDAGWELKQQWNKQKIVTYCAVELHVFYNPRFEPDVDAYVKVTLDRLEKIGIISNDRFFKKLTVEKHPDSIKPHMEITITFPY